MSDSDSHPDLPHEGSGTWAHGRVDYSWSLTDVSHLHDRMQSAENALFFLIKARLKERRLFKSLFWIQYTEARLNGEVYTPDPTPEDPNPWPWIGIDRCPNMRSRKDNLPYSNTPEEQERVNWGYAYDGRIRDLYKPDADSIDVDWASSNIPGWSHYSVITLIGREYTGKEWALGSLTWKWSIDSDGKMGQFGGLHATTDDIAKWTAAMTAGNPTYMNDVFAGEWRPEFT
ncbi:hypothetical protein BH10PLA1_BH10PLA1_06670 [soil metagenome]